MQLIEDFYAAAQTGDAEKLREILSPQWEEHPPAYPGQPAGPDGYVPVAQMLARAFPDARFEIHEIIDASPKFTVRTTMHGTHRGEFLGHAATGKRLSFDTIDIHEVRDGKIVNSWHIEDFAGLFAQMGA